MLIVHLKGFGIRWIERVGDKCQEKSIIKTSSNRTSSISKNARFWWSILQRWLSSSAYRKQRWFGCHLQIEYHDLSTSGIVWDGTCLVCWSGSNLDAREDILARPKKKFLRFFTLESLLWQQHRSFDFDILINLSVSRWRRIVSRPSDGQLRGFSQGRQHRF